MADPVAHLADRGFPHLPVRQWVLTLPYASFMFIFFLLAFHREKNRMSPTCLFAI